MKRRVPYLLSAFVALSACDGATLTLGSDEEGIRDASRPDVSDAKPSPPTPSCPTFTSDDEYALLRGTTCEGQCSDSLTPERDLSMATMLSASLTGGWTFCSGSLGAAVPADTTGIQFYTGCTFFLIEGDAGAVPGTNATYDVVTTDGGYTAGTIILHLSTGDVYASVAASSCLGRAQLTIDGGVIEMSSLVPVATNPAK